MFAQPTRRHDNIISPLQLAKLQLFSRFSSQKSNEVDRQAYRFIEKRCNGDSKTFVGHEVEVVLRFITMCFTSDYRPPCRKGCRKPHVGIGESMMYHCDV